MDQLHLRRVNLRAMIDKIRKERNLSSDSAFCDQYENLTASHLSQMIRGKGTFGEKVARSLEELLQLDNGYLDQDHGLATSEVLQKVFGKNWKDEADPKLVRQALDLQSNNDFKKSEILENRNKFFDNNVVPVTTKLLPVLSWVQAGTMTAMEPTNLTDVIDWQPPLSLDDPDGCFYLRVVGVSNSPVYIEGDLILVDPGVYFDDLVSGDLVVVRNNTDATFKKLIIESDNRKYLQALNPEWKPNIIEFEDGMVLVGIVIDATRPLGGSRRKRVRRI
ncbi:S24 family peptidase [Acinetobacter sp. Ac_5812]|uniref:S24 family peptidase n=1 Tax=Acinetobacter sp. Ac_5812 TaxID=1848937 RepID=UPI0020915038|nr:S24 family peptidase [Acinetobacter sp. Ac_5812]